MNSSALVRTKLSRARRFSAGVVAILGLTVGIMAPAMALTRTDSNMDFTEGNGGNESARWTDSSPDYADSRVTVAQGCNRDFTVTIREDKSLQPDPSRGAEWINCTSYADATYASSSTDFSKKHHYDGTDIGLVSAKPYVPKHAVFNAVVRW